MLPTLWPGDVLEVRRERAAEISPGDLVLFERDGRFIAHRVVEVRDSGFGTRDPGEPTPWPESLGPGPGSRVSSPESRTLITRGDRTRQCDPPVLPDELLGRVAAIVRGGVRLSPRLSLWRWLGSWALTRSELATRVVLHFGVKGQDLGFRIQGLGICDLRFVIGDWRFLRTSDS
jgi:hypothetical protein